MALIISMPAKSMMKISACMIKRKKRGGLLPFFFFFEKFVKNFTKNLDEALPKIVKDFTKNLDERLLVNFFTKILDKFRLKNIFLDFF